MLEITFSGSESVLLDGPSEAASLDLDFVLTARSRKHLASLGKSMYRRKLPSRVGALATKHIPNSVAVEDVHTPLPVDKILYVLVSSQSIYDTKRFFVVARSIVAKNEKRSLR